MRGWGITGLAGGIAGGLLLLGAAVPGGAAAAVLPSGDPHAFTARSADQPNVVIILTDDQRDGTVSAMPAVQRLLVEQGVTFTQAQSATPTCCPARASLLTGNLAPRTGVFANWAAEGGWSTFHQNGWDSRTLAARLDAVGYRTALSGKYLNGYAMPGLRAGLTGESGYVPPGWDEWFAFGLAPGTSASSNTRDQAYYDYSTIRRSAGDAVATYERHGEKARDYSTDVFGKFAVDFISSTPSSTPLFLMYTPYGPHAPYLPAPRHANSEVPEFAEPPLTSTAGKPRWVTSRDEVGPAESRQLRKAQTRALLSVDEWVGRIVEELQSTGRLDNTILVFASDNGLTWGEFHLIGSKNYPYVADIPMVMRWDAAPRGSALERAGARDGRLVSLTDISTTVLKAAGADASGTVDGINLVNPQASRESLLLTAARSRGEQGSRPMPPFCGVRTLQWLYARYGTGFEELYRVATDPQFMVNRVDDPDVADVVRRFRAQIKQECDPAPPHYRW